RTTRSLRHASIRWPRRSSACCPGRTSFPDRARSTSSTSFARRGSSTTPTATPRASIGRPIRATPFLCVTPTWIPSATFPRYFAGRFGGILDGSGSSANGRLFMKGQGAAIGWNRLIGAKVVNEFRLGWGRNDSVAVQGSFGLDTAEQFGFKGVTASPVIGGG